MKNKYLYMFWDVWALKQYIMYPDTQLFPYIFTKVYSSETTNNEKYDHHLLGDLE